MAGLVYCNWCWQKPWVWNKLWSKSSSWLHCTFPPMKSFLTKVSLSVCSRQGPCCHFSVWKQLHLKAEELPATRLCLQSLCDCAEAGLHSPKKHSRVFVTPDNSRTSLLQPLRVIRLPSAIPFRKRENGRPCLAAQRCRKGFVTEGPCSRNAACRGLTMPRAEAQPHCSSSGPRLLLCQTRNLSHCCRPLRLNSTSQLGGGSFFPPSLLRLPNTIVWQIAEV